MLYRANVGIALFNAAGQVLIARRLRDDGPEIIYPGHEWQMPQGGIDPREDPRVAAQRELFEETGIRDAEYLGSLSDWFTYDFPPYDGPAHRLSMFRGQRQKWFAFRFLGRDGDIDVGSVHANDAEPEFSAWRWEALEATPALVVPFKRGVYERVVRGFAPFAVADTALAGPGAA